MDVGWRWAQALCTFNYTAVDGARTRFLDVVTDIIEHQSDE